MAQTKVIFLSAYIFLSLSIIVFCTLPAYEKHKKILYFRTLQKKIETDFSGFTVVHWLV